MNLSDYPVFQCRRCTSSLLDLDDTKSRKGRIKETREVATQHQYRGCSAVQCVWCVVGGPSDALLYWITSTYPVRRYLGTYMPTYPRTV